MLLTPSVEPMWACSLLWPMNVREASLLCVHFLACHSGQGMCDSASTLNKEDRCTEEIQSMQTEQTKAKVETKECYFKLLSFGDCLLWRPNASDTLVLMKCYSFTEKKRGTEHHGKSEREETWALLHESMCMICRYVRRLLTKPLDNPQSSKCHRKTSSLT